MITCQIDGAQCHVIATYLKKTHPTWSLDDYRQAFPDAPLLSETAKARLAEKKREKAAEDAKNTTAMAAASSSTAKVASMEDRKPVRRAAMHEVFELGKAKAALNKRGEPIPITVVQNAGEYARMVPAKDGNYIFNIDLLKTALMGFELNIPVYLWGHAGVGKTTVLEQLCAFTGRPFLRVQHTANMEESHVIGQWTARDGRTVFELGPLAVAMKYGLTYCADEYDFAMPHVLSVYQPVLEGKALVIKEADDANRVIEPHPLFRFCATGNTNGAGDDTGLYQGTNLQNFANYERFGIVEKVEYMPKAQEVSIIQKQAGILKDDAEKLVRYAHDIRKAYDGGKIGATISIRALINAGTLGLRRGSYRDGLKLAFINRLTTVDAETADQFAQRVLG